MKTILNKTILIIFLLVIGQSFGQAKKPSLLIIPSDNWCIQNGYFDVIDNKEVLVTVYDYVQPLAKDRTFYKKYINDTAWKQRRITNAYLYS